MEYTLLTKTWGGMNYRLDPAAIGPGAAQDVKGIDLSDGTVKNDYQVLFTTLAFNVTSSGYFGASQVKSTSGNATRADYDFGNPYTYHAYGERVIRVPRYAITSGWVPQYTTSSVAPVWQALGIKKPVVGSFAMASGGAGALTGAYKAVVVFYNAFGDESARSSEVTFTAASNDIDYSGIPIGYGTGDLNSSTSITNVANPSYFRVGMRITAPAGIPAGTYVTAISGTTITISQAATATTVGVQLQDAQVTGRRIYRTIAGGSDYYLAVTIADVTTTTYAGDNTTDAALVLLDALVTDADHDVLPATYGATLSPDGWLMGITGSTNDNTPDLCFAQGAFYFLSKATYRIESANKPTQVFYGLNRFIVFTSMEIWFVLGDEPGNFDVLKTSVVAPTANGATYYGGVHPVEMPDGSVWFLSSYGVTRFDGASIERLTERVFTDAQNGSIGYNSLAAVTDKGRYILITTLDSRSTSVALMWDPLVPGWRCIDAGGTLTPSAFTGAAWVDNSVSPAKLYYYMGDEESQTYPSAGLGTNGIYWTGEWTGERHSDLKKFRRVSVLHNGNVTVQPYVDGAVAGSAQPLTRATLGRSVFWLPSGTKGRGVSVKMTLTNTAAEVHEVGVWVGEERGPMP